MSSDQLVAVFTGKRIILHLRIFRLRFIFSPREFSELSRDRDGNDLMPEHAIVSTAAALVLLNWFLLFLT